MKKAISFLSVFLTVIGFVFAQNPMSGSYTISSDETQNPHFSTIQSAIDALVANGATGGVELQILPGTYVEFVTIPAIASLGEDNWLVIRGMGETFHDVVITQNAGYTSNPIVKINGADYISISNLKLTTSSTNYSNLVVFENGVNHITFDGVYFLGPNVTINTLNNDKQLVYDNSKESFDSDIQFLNCHFINGYIALYLQGKNTITPMDKNLVVQNCRFENQFSKSIYATFQENMLISGNTVVNNNDLKDGYQGIDIYWVADEVVSSVIENNVVTIDFDTKYATGIEVRPGIGTEETPVIIRNNMVSIKSSQDLNYGFLFSHNSGKYINLAHNSVLFDQNTGGSLLFINNNVDYIRLSNNLFVNNGRGYIYRFQKTMPNRTSDYNRILLSDEVMLGRVGTEELNTLADWQAFTESMDLASAVIAANPYISNTNLHIISSDNLTVANPLDYVLLDIDGEERSATEPCAGADELLPAIDLPPYVANPISNIEITDFPGSVTLDLTNTFADPDNEAAEIVLSVQSNSNPSLVKAEFEADNRSLLVERLTQNEGLVTIGILALSNGLSVETSFTVQCVNEDLPPVVADPIAPVVFNEFPQTIEVNLQNTFSDPDSPAALMELSIQNFSSSNFTALIDDKTLTLSRISLSAFDGESVTIRCTSEGLYVETTVAVSGTAVTMEWGVATMEDVPLGVDGYWVPSETGENTMISNTWAFYNYYETYFWGGFTASNQSDASLSGYNAQYTAVTLSGYNGSQNYAVAYASGFPTDVTPLDGLAGIISGCYVTNNVWAYEAILEGDGMTPYPFGGATGNDPDYFRIFAVGKTADNQNTDTLYFYLADYRFEDNSLDYVVDSWEWFDLSGLGAVKSVRFGLQSTKSNDWGMTTPGYFCMDNFNGEGPNQPPYIANPLADIMLDQFPQSVSVSLAGVVTDPDDDDELIAYQLINNTNSVDFEVTIENKMLNVSRITNTNSTAIVTIRATSNGQTIEFDANIIGTMVTGIEMEMISALVYPNPASDYIKVVISGQSAAQNNANSYSIVNNLGQRVKTGSLHSETIAISNLPKGNYILLVLGKDGMTILRQRFVKM